MSYFATRIQLSKSFAKKNDTSRMAALKMNRQEIRLLSKKEVCDRQRDLLKGLNGNTFFPLKLWPRDMQAVFWKKPMGDTKTFKLVLFFIGNGCALLLFTEWDSIGAILG